MSFRFRRFKVYQDAKLLHKEIVRLTRRFPRDFFYLKDQVRRSSLSAVLNIAEGSAKDSDKDFNRYIQNALGSTNETASSLDVALGEELVTKKRYDKVIDLCESVVKQLGGFSKKLKVGG